MKALERTALTVGLLLLLAGCTNYIIPPKSPPNPTTVWVIEYHRHASLALREDSGSVEYAYGEWKWFALGQNQSGRAFPVLFCPSQGTLGWRELPDLPTNSPELQDQGAEHIQGISVSREKVAVLKERLDRQISENMKTAIYNAESDMDFVKVTNKYCGCRNCNAEVAHWLEELDCQVKGSRLFSKFQVLPSD